MIQTFDNESFLGKEMCFHVTYPDVDNDVNQFRFELYIYVKIGNSFGYRHFHTWEFADDELIPAGDDNVVDFVLGNSNATTPDLLLPPYQNLPANCNYKITGAFAPGSLGGYVDAQITGFGNGYDFASGTFASWCADKDITINAGQDYPMDVYSSLYPDALPAFTAYGEKWAKVNWLFNNSDLYPSSTWATYRERFGLL